MIRNYVEDLKAIGINFVDLGSSGSLDPKWESVRPIINYIGFDPNEEECLRQNTLPTEFRSARYLPYAVDSVTCERTLYKTKSIYCYSLLNPDQQWLERFSFSDLFKIIDEIPIQAVGISEIAELRGISVDILKIDVQGIELRILKNAGRLLDNTFYLETENGFTRNYTGENTYAELDEFLRESGFLMFDINTDHRIPRKNIFAKHPTGKEQILWAESVWLKDYIGLDRHGKFEKLQISRDDAKKALVICAIQGCIDFGYELADFFKLKQLISKAEFDNLSKSSDWAFLISSKQKIKSTPEESYRLNALAKLLSILPPRLLDALKKASAIATEKK